MKPLKCRHIKIQVKHHSIINSTNKPKKLNLRIKYLIIEVKEWWSLGSVERPSESGSISKSNSFEAHVIHRVVRSVEHITQDPKRASWSRYVHTSHPEKTLGLSQLSHLRMGKLNKFLILKTQYLLFVTTSDQAFKPQWSRVPDRCHFESRNIMQDNMFLPYICNMLGLRLKFE